MGQILTSAEAKQHRRFEIISDAYAISILRTKLARDRAVRAKFVEIRVRFNQGKV